jgi:anti-sigma B factor antagonist
VSAITNVRNVGSVTILKLGPRLTLVEGSELRDAVVELLAEGRSSVLLDCAVLDFVDSQGIGLLVRTWMSAGRGGKLKVFSLTPRVRELLQITGLFKVMECYDDVGSALQSFSRQASA